MFSSYDLLDECFSKWPVHFSRPCYKEYRNKDKTLQIFD